MPSNGIVREFHADEGWGVIDGSDVPGGAWTSFAAIRVDGYRSLTAGQRVTFVAEPGDQDGYAFRAVTVWPGDESAVPERPAGPSDAYSSSLTLTYDESTD